MTFKLFFVGLEHFAHYVKQLKSATQAETQKRDSRNPNSSAELGMQTTTGGDTESHRLPITLHWNLILPNWPLDRPGFLPPVQPGKLCLPSTRWLLYVNV